MSFRPFKLEWQGRGYDVPANQIMGLLAAVEDVLTLAEMQRFSARGASPLAKIAQAYAAALNYANIDATPEEVLTRFSLHDPDGASDKIARLLTLAFIEAPPVDEAPAGGNAPKAAGASSKPRTRAPSPAANG